jgi:hypothetical protein
MAQKKRGKQSSRSLSMINPNAAGIDVGSTFHVVAVPADRAAEAVRTFQTFTSDLHRLVDWLQEIGITTVSMESTGVYWIPVFEILEARGLEVHRGRRPVDTSRTSPAGRPTSMTPSGCSSYTNMAFCGEVSVRTTAWWAYERTSAIASGWSSLQRPTSSTCRRR